MPKLQCQRMLLVVHLSPKPSRLLTQAYTSPRFLRVLSLPQAQRPTSLLTNQGIRVLLRPMPLLRLPVQRLSQPAVSMQLRPRLGHKSLHTPNHIMPMTRLFRPSPITTIHMRLLHSLRLPRTVLPHWVLGLSRLRPPPRLPSLNLLSLGLNPSEQCRQRMIPRF